MALKSSNKINPNFNMSSLTDIIFLLLIFFLLTSNFILPRGLDLVLPSSNSPNVVEEHIAVEINQDGVYRVQDEETAFEDISTILSDKLGENPEQVVVLYADENQPLKKTIDIMNIVKGLNGKMILATEDRQGGDVE